MKNVALYVRVSTQEQRKHGLSVDSQIVALEEYAKEHGYNVVGIYNDAGISARKRFTKRPALLKLMQDCDEGKVELILFTKLDRYFRSVADYYEVQTVLDRNKVAWRAIWEDYETETSSGVFKVNIMLSVAQSEADRTSERIKSTFDYKRAKGDYVGCAPTGYKRQDNKLVIDEEQEPMIRLIFETYLKTHSTSKTLAKVTEAGFNISRSGLMHILGNETYTGDANGTTCPAYITKEQKAEIEAIKKQHYKEPVRSNEYMFPRICICGYCGKRMRYLTSCKDGKLYASYYCTGTYSTTKHEKSVTVSEKKLEKYLLNEIELLVANYNIEALTQAVDNDLGAILKKRKALEAKLERVGVRFEDGDISKEEYKTKREAILKELASLPTKEKSIKTITLPDGWREIYNDLDVEHRREFWLSIIESITLYNKIEANPPAISFKP